jgi:hypothetical protein
MAGAVLISKGSSFSTSGVTFELMLDTIRCELKDDQKVARQIFPPSEDISPEYISLMQLDSDEYRAFHRAIVRAASRALSTTPKIVPQWQELLALLETDSRLA